MQENNILKGKRVLIVDDERDVLEIIEEFLSICEIDTADNYESAKEYLESKSYEVVILDIMGVNGYDLLTIANKKKIPAIMITAHALSPADLVASLKLGAEAYVPKEELKNIRNFVENIITDRQNGMKKSAAFFPKLKPIFDKLFGLGWMEDEKEFWDDFKKRFIDTHYL